MSFETSLIKFLLIFLAIAANAFFVAAEFALARTRVSKIQSSPNNHKASYQLLEQALVHINDYISAAQIGITIASLIVGALAERLFSNLFSYIFLHVLDISSSVHIYTIEGISFILAIGFATMWHVILGEFIPKTLAIQSPENIAIMTIVPLHIFYRCTMPLVYILNQIALLVLKPFGIDILSRGEISYSEDEIKYLLKQGEKEGIIESNERELVDNVFEFGDTVVREVMTPRTKILGVNKNAHFNEIVQISINKHLSKIPVYEDNLDNIIGVIYAKDILKCLYDKESNCTIDTLTKPVIKIPENKPIDDLLGEFRSAHIHIAIIIDEFGGTAGLVTLEDLIEEIVGEISSENEIITPDIQIISDDEWLIQGDTAIGDINKTLDTEFSDEHFDTIGGFVMGLFGRDPDVGDSIDYMDRWTFQVTKKDRTIEEICIRKNIIITLEDHKD